MPDNSVEIRLGAIDATLKHLSAELEQRFISLQEAARLALEANDKTVAVAQSTADKAVAKAEAAAGKEYLESQIEGLRNTLTQQIVSQKEAISAALAAAKDALTAALSSAEKAIAKAEEATEKRFASVNEFRAQLSDQQKTFVVKAEVDFKLDAVAKKLDEMSSWQRLNDLKFNEYVTISNYERVLGDFTIWRRAVDNALTAASSKSGLIYSGIALAISLGVLVIALFNLLSKAPVNVPVG